LKGVGPKTGIKLIKSLGTIEAICAEKGKDVPNRLQEIREIFLDHPSNNVEAEALKPGQVDVKGLIQFLQEEREFSQRRIDEALTKLRKANLIRAGGQTSLFSF